MLWQVAMIANESISRVDASAAYRQLLVDRLSLDYPIDHEVIVYRAAILPIDGPRVRKVALRDIAKIPMTAEETVVVPPAEAIQRDEEFMRRAAVLHEIYGRPIAV